MSAEGTTVADHKAASIWYVDRAVRASQLVSGDPSDPRALVLVRDNSRNSAFVDIGGTDHPETGPRVFEVEPTLARGWEEGTGADVDATVVMCMVGSCDIPEDAMRAILAQDHQRFTLVVVDNAPHVGLTREKLMGIDDTRLNIVSASRPDLSHVRNRGALAARGRVIVFTDDDVIVDPYWLTAMIDPSMASPYVTATTGIALPLEQRYALQRWFESYGGFPKDMPPRVQCVGDIPEGLGVLGEKGDGGPLFPITTVRMGAGVCMAMRRDVFVEVGPSDPALGVGTSTRGGEDPDVFARILVAGDVIIHTSDAPVHHRRRVDEAGLDKQVRGGGLGMVASLTKAITAKLPILGTLTVRVPDAFNHVKPGGARVAGIDKDVPGSLTKSEIKGLLESPLLYLSSRTCSKLGASHQAERAPTQDSATAPSSAGEAQASPVMETTGEGNGNA